MTRTLKALGLALGALLAMSAVMAAGAQADQEHTFKSDSPTGKTILTSHSGGHKFQIGGPEGPFVSCKKATFEGTVGTNLADTVTVKPTYSECEGFLGEAEVNTNHCAYIFDSDTVETAGTGKEHADVDVECSNGSVIEIVEPGVCTMGVGPQTDLLDGVSYNNIPNHEGKEAVEVTATAKGIDYFVVEDPGFCFLLPGGGEGTDGTYDGTAIVTGYEDKGPALSGTETTTPNYDAAEGAQVNVTMTTP